MSVASCVQLELLRRLEQDDMSDVLEATPLSLTTKRAHVALTPLFQKNTLSLSVRTVGRLNTAASRVNALSEEDMLRLFAKVGPSRASVAT